MFFQAVLAQNRHDSPLKSLTIGTIGNSLCPVGREPWVGGAGGRGAMNPHQGGQGTAALAMAQAGVSIKRRLP